LGEFCLCFYAEAAGVVEKFVDRLIGDFSVEEFADAGLRLGQDELEFFLGVFFGEFEDGLVKLGFELESGGICRGKAKVIKDVSTGYMRWFVSLLFHVFSLPPDVL